MNRPYVPRVHVPMEVQERDSANRVSEAVEKRRVSDHKRMMGEFKEALRPSSIAEEIENAKAIAIDQARRLVLECRAEGVVCNIMRDAAIAA